MVIHKKNCANNLCKKNDSCFFTKHTNHRRDSGSDVSNSHSKRFLEIPVLCAIKDHVSSDCLYTLQNPEQKKSISLKIYFFKNKTQVSSLKVFVLLHLHEHAEKGKS